MKESIKLDDGKYEVILTDNGREFEALKYGEKWRNLIGDNLVLNMFFEIQNLHGKLKKFEELIENEKIYQLIQQGKKSDSGERYSLEQVLQFIKKIKL